MILPVSVQQKPVMGGTLKVAINADPLQMNVIVKFWNPVAIAVSNTLSTLVNFDKDYHVVGNLAKSWMFGSDGKSISFKLRDDVWWSDGVKFSSADVKWHYLMLLNGSSVVKSRLRGLTTIDTPDDYTVTFNFSAPRNQINLLLPFGIFSSTGDQRILPKHTYRWGTTFNFTDNPANSGVGIPTTGPFVVSEYKQGQSMTFVRSPFYGTKSFTDRHPAYMDKMIFQYIPEATSQIAALQNGQVHVVHEGGGVVVSPQDLGRVSKLQGISVAGRPYYTIWRVTFNFGNASKDYPWVRDRRVREAFAHSINKQNMVQTLLLNITTTEDGPISSLAKDWYNPGLTKYEYNPAKAEQLLDDAGYKRDSSGTRIKAPLVTYASGTLFAEAIKSDLQKVGIVLDLQPIEDTTFYSKFETGPTGLNPYPVALQTFGGGPFPFNVDSTLAANSFSPSGQNCGFYNNTQVNQLIDQANKENDVSKIRDLYNQEQEIVSKDLPAIYLWDHWKINVWNSDYKGIVESMLPEPSYLSQGMSEIWWTKAPQQTATISQTIQPTSGMDTSISAAVAAVLVITTVAVLMVRKRKATPSS